MRKWRVYVYKGKLSGKMSCKTREIAEAFKRSHQRNGWRAWIKKIKGTRKLR